MGIFGRLESWLKGRARGADESSRATPLDRAAPPDHVLPPPVDQAPCTIEDGARLAMLGARGEVTPGKDGPPKEVPPKVGSPALIRERLRVPSRPKARARRNDPYFIQVGFDFGTSYSKCVCRDVITDKAWVHIPPGKIIGEHPFLIPSAVSMSNGRFSRLAGTRVHYPEGGLYHLKLALEKVALREWEDPVLEPYLARCASRNHRGLVDLVESATVYLLAGAFSDIRRDIRSRYSDFGALADDYVAVNMAIPVADAENPEVEGRFRDVLIRAWKLGDQLAGYSAAASGEPRNASVGVQNKADESLASACFIYPEVSANVQGYIRSRSSTPGMYLLSDIGAGTVDQSVFVFARNDGEELLTYLHGSVLPWGSSRIEYQAAQGSGKLDSRTLEVWREKKERGHDEPELRMARALVAEGLGLGTRCTLARAKKKLYFKDQILDTRVIFTGGGHCQNPYETAVVRQFSGQLFSRPVSPDIIGLPRPRDLELDQHQHRWMARLSVAYGLSFEKGQLARFTYPKDVPTPNPEEIWQPSARIRIAPTKDEC